MVSASNTLNAVENILPTFIKLSEQPEFAKMHLYLIYQIIKKEEHEE